MFTVNVLLRDTEREREGERDRGRERQSRDIGRVREEEQ